MTITAAPTASNTMPVAVRSCGYCGSRGAMPAPSGNGYVRGCCDDAGDHVPSVVFLDPYDALTVEESAVLVANA